MIFDFSKKEDVISFGSISSPLLKKISRKFIKNINNPETIIYTDNVEDLKYFLTKGLDLNIPFCNIQKNKMKIHVSENIKNLDKLKFLHEHGFDFKSDMYVNIHILKKHELREYYVNNIYPYQDKINQAHTIEAIIRQKDLDIFKLFVNKFNIDLNDQETFSAAFFYDKNVFQLAFYFCAYDIAKYLVMEKGFDFFEPEINSNLHSEKLMEFEIEINQSTYEQHKVRLEKLRADNTKQVDMELLSDITERHEEKIKMMSLYQDIVKEQRQSLNSSINVKPVNNISKARL